MPACRCYRTRSQNIARDRNGGTGDILIGRLHSRRTKVVSKAVEMVDLSLRIDHHFHDNPGNFAALAATFLCIFS
jgi:hypothetical protein